MTTSVQAISPGASPLLTRVEEVRAKRQINDKTEAEIVKATLEKAHEAHRHLVKDVLDARKGLDDKVLQASRETKSGQPVKAYLFSLHSFYLNPLGITIELDPTNLANNVKTNDLLLQDLFEFVQSKGLNVKCDIHRNLGSDQYMIYAVVPDDVANPSTT